uniref:Easter-10 n=1 Tax=Nilaparvata lugens TaxID=108931 RepID=A0A068FB69_NILLU|nr:easter-10 [Nilaparvata lugens]
MKTLCYIIAVTFIKWIQGQPPEEQDILTPLFHPEICGLQPAIQTDPFTNYVKEREVVHRGEYPWVVFLEVGHPDWGIGKFTCKGSIISKRFVLTAARCLMPYRELVNRTNESIAGLHLSNEFTVDPSMYFSVNFTRSPNVVVRAGETNLKDVITSCDEMNCPPNVYLSKSVVWYFDDEPPEEGHDVALVETTKDIVFNDYVLPICLQPLVAAYNQLYKRDYLGERGIRVTGWGIPSSNDQFYFKLQKVPGHIFTEEEIVEFYYKYMTLSFRDVESYVSFFGVGDLSDGLHHDSDIGSPFIIKKMWEWGRTRYYLYGVYSFMANVSLPPYETTFVYSRVSHYLDWILENVETISRDY